MQMQVLQPHLVWRCVTVLGATCSVSRTYPWCMMSMLWGLRMPGSVRM